MRKPEPIEVVLIAIPLLCEAIAVILFIAAMGLGAGILSGVL